MADVVSAIGSAPTHYILISTDSVYMSCLPPDAAASSGASEGQATRPGDAQLRQALCNRNPYQT